MGAMKRKADPAAAPPKKDQAAKRQRKSDAAEHPPAAIAKPERSAPATSVFKDEEKSFPRGGASVLTPLEHKQISIKANQDVLFEQAGQKKRGGDDGLSDEGSEMGEDDAPKTEKKRKSKKSKTDGAEEGQVQKIKAESLTFKVCMTPAALNHSC